MAPTKYGQYIVKDFIRESRHEKVIVPSVNFNGETCGANFSFRWSFISAPFQMINEPHKHDFDQVLGFLGGNPMDIGDFRAEVEFWLEGEKQTINTATFIRIPKGLSHGPLNFKRIDLPIQFLDMPLSPGYSRVGHPEITSIP